MRNVRSTALAAGLCVTAAAFSPSSAAQTPRELTGYLPADTPLVVDLFDAPACAENAFALLEPLPKDLPAAARLFLLGLPLFTKAATGMDLSDLLGTVAPGQAAFAMFPAQKPFPVILTRVSEPDAVRSLLKRLRNRNGLHTDIDDGVLTVSNSAQNLRTVLRFRKSGKSTLLGSDEYRRGRVALKPGRSIRVFLNVEVVRKTYAKLGGIWDQLDGGARFLIGPLVRIFDLADRIDGRLDITKRGLSLHGQANASLEKDPLEVGRLASAGAKGRVVAPFPKDTLACVSIDRDVGELLNHPDRWLGEDGSLGVKSFLSVADQILGGASLLKDLLPNIEMPMDLFVTGSTTGDEEEPRIKLPAFTLVFGLGDDDRKVKRLLNRSLSTITFIANANRAQEKKTPIMARSGRRDGYQFQRIRFGDWNGPGEPPTEQGLSPTLLFAHGHGILASTIDGAVRMAEALKGGKGQEIQGDFLTLRGGPIAEVFGENISLLAIDRVFKEGETLKQAEAVLKGIESVIRIFEFSARVKPRTGATSFVFDLRRTR